MEMNILSKINYELMIKKEVSNKNINLYDDFNINSKKLLILKINYHKDTIYYINS